MADELCILDVCLLFQSKNIQDAVNNRGKWRSKNRASAHEKEVFVYEMNASILYSFKPQRSASMTDIESQRMLEWFWH